MARRKSRLARTLRPKRAAFALFRALASLHPRAPLRLGFFSRDAGPDYPSARVFEDRSVPHALQDSRFRASLESFSRQNWDVVGDDEGVPRSASRVRVDVLDGMLVPGHTLTPVEPRSLAQIAIWQPRVVTWNNARPAPVALKRLDVAGLAAVVPPIRHYGHIMTDILIPLARAVELGALDGEVFTILTAKGRPPLVDAFVDGLRVLECGARLIELTVFEHARPERFLVATQRSWNRERTHVLAGTMPFARRIFEAAYADRAPIAPGRRLYLTRGKVKLRLMLNEDELISMLKERGFDIFEARWDNHHEQVARFAAADIVVGVHGAGLINLVWCRPGAEVIEIFPDDFRKTTGLHIAAEHGLGHTPFFGSKEGRNQAFAVDVKAFSAVVDGRLHARSAPP